MAQSCRASSHWLGNKLLASLPLGTWFCRGDLVGQMFRDGLTKCLLESGTFTADTE